MMLQTFPRFLAVSLHICFHFCRRIMAGFMMNRETKKKKTEEQNEWEMESNMELAKFVWNALAKFDLRNPNFVSCCSSLPSCHIVNSLHRNWTCTLNQDMKLSHILVLSRESHAVQWIYATCYGIAWHSIKFSPGESSRSLCPGALQEVHWHRPGNRSETLATV